MYVFLSLMEVPNNEMVGLWLKDMFTFVRHSWSFLWLHYFALISIIYENSSFSISLAIFDFLVFVILVIQLGVIFYLFMILICIFWGLMILKYFSYVIHISSIWLLYIFTLFDFLLLSYKSSFYILSEINIA